MNEPDVTLSLIQSAKLGDACAMERLVTDNEPLVRSIVRKFIGRGAEYEDLAQIGRLGLIKAIRNFDTSYDVRFSTYAVPMISGEIKRFLRDDGMIKVSRSLKELSYKAAKAREELFYRLSREPTLTEIAAETQADPEDVAMALESTRTHVSVFEPISEGDDSQLIDRLSGYDKTDDTAVDNVLLKQLISCLGDRDKQIIALRYFSDMTQGEIAKRLGVSQVQVSRLESRILSRMREMAGGL